MYNLVFHPKADDEFLNSFEWYEEQQVGLGEQFLFSVEEALDKIKINPLQYQIQLKKYRQALTEVFPFVICFEVNEEKQLIYIVAIIHTSRNPKQKLRRKF